MRWDADGIKKKRVRLDPAKKKIILLISSQTATVIVILQEHPSAIQVECQSGKDTHTY